MRLQRLDKTICDTGSYTRSQARVLIKSGRVTVNQETVTSPEQKFDGESDLIALDGQMLNCKRMRYIMMNKPAGVVCATRDKNQPTVMELLPPEYKALGLHPVGRLDKDTTGLLLLTNDGDFTHGTTSPASHVSKVYDAVVDGELTLEDREAFRQGVVLRDGTHCHSAQLSFEENNKSRCLVTIDEGKYHQVKRMLASRGKPVKCLHRISVGELRLDESLKPGDFRELTREELEGLLKEICQKRNNIL